MPHKKKTPAKYENKSEVMTAFPTYIHRVEHHFKGIEKFNSGLALALYRMRSDDPDGIFRSNQSGTWHSKDTVFTDTGEFGKQLQQMFYKSFEKLAGYYIKPESAGKALSLRMQAWAMMSRNGGYASPHSHPNCHFSGVYYVDIGEPQEAQQLATNVMVTPGSIEFIDTRYGVGQQQVPGFSFNPSFRSAPRAGRMFTFPSGLPHWVHPVKGDGERIAISCNATIAKLEKRK